jgi:hypothetical protein
VSAVPAHPPPAPKGPLSSTWEERDRERRFAGQTPAAPSLQPGPIEETPPGSRKGSFDTAAFGALLRMKIRVFHARKPLFMLSSWPQASVSKRATRARLPGTTACADAHRRNGHR